MRRLDIKNEANSKEQRNIIPEIAKIAGSTSKLEEMEMK